MVRDNLWWALFMETGSIDAYMHYNERKEKHPYRYKDGAN